MIAGFTVMAFLLWGLTIGSLLINRQRWINVMPIAPIPLIIMLFVIEVFSHCIRPVSLFVRILVNMLVGHILLSVAKGVGLLVVVLLEFMVAVVQGVVFYTLLRLY